MNEKNLKDLELLLFSNKIAERIRSIKLIRKQRLVQLSEEVYNLYLIEKKKNNSWLIQCELLDTLGSLKNYSVLQSAEDICLRNEEFDMITMRAAGCVLRLTRADIGDIRPIKKLITMGKYSVVYGTLSTMGKDRMQFEHEDILYLINFIEMWPYSIPEQYMDIRIGLANACAGWEKTESVQSFLHSCMEGEEPLQGISKKALQGKYSDLS